MADAKVLTAHLPLDLAGKVDAMAARLERARGWVTKRVLAAWVGREAERHRTTLEALAEVEAGQAIAHQAVQAWADRLGTERPLPPPEA